MLDNAELSRKEIDAYEAAQNRDWHQAKVVVIAQLVSLIGAIGVGFFWLGTIASDLDAVERTQSAHELFATQRFSEVDARITREIKRQSDDTRETRETLRRIEEKLDQTIRDMGSSPGSAQ